MEKSLLELIESGIVFYLCKDILFFPKMRRRGKKFLRILFFYIPTGFVLFTVLWVLLFKWVPVYYTPLMAIRSIENFSDTTYRTYKTWKPLSEMSPYIARAVIAGEDNRFADHNGFDWIEIDNALDAQKKGKKLRGASTISQQTAKNVFLYPGRSWFRKGMEAYFTLLIETIWGKERILEVYLNVAEMGRGIYGAEAAAERLFSTRASKLTARQSALIAASLPNPLKRKANAPTAYMNRRADDIEKIMRTLPYPDWIKNAGKSKDRKRNGKPRAEDK